MNVILITTGRPGSDLLHQSINSLVKNAVNRDAHTLTVVQDGYATAGVDCFQLDNRMTECNQLIVNQNRVGASRSRNIGASSIPKYLRQSHVMFIDDDVYMCPGWDARMQIVLDYFEPAHLGIYSGHAHPFNSTVIHETKDYVETTVISTCHMLMPWKVWDEVGWFVEPGGPGGSEDVDYCKRATGKGFFFIVSKPHCVIHCGLISSSGKQLVGYEEMVRQNQEVSRVYGLKDVLWGA